MDELIERIEELAEQNTKLKAANAELEKQNAELLELEGKEAELKAELEVKGVRYPVPFACSQPLNPDGSLTIKGMINV